MKLDARQVEAFLRDPASATVVLLHGEDVGLIRERGRRLVEAAAGSVDDPFRVVEIERDAADTIPAEMASIPMNGGRRVVRVRDGSDGLADIARRVLEADGGGLLVIEAPELPARGKLRGLVERAPRGVAIGCYPQEGRALEREIRGVLEQGRVGIDEDALAWLAGHLGADLAMTRSEAEKLALYAGPGGRVDLAAARACVGDLAGLSLEDALFAATAGDVAGADRALELAMAEGATPVGVVRAALQHVQRLQRARAAMAGGADASAAAKGLRPPVFFRREPAFVAALGMWSEAALVLVGQRLWEAERAIKQTGAPAEAICRNAILAVARRAAALRRR